jgi:probable rRNA maturation factor
LNEQFLGHPGSTDVIAFDYEEETEGGGWCGEIFISVDDAVASAPRFRATWQLELARYLVHGMLHLRGYDDQEPAARREMKREENRLLKALSRRFDWSKLERPKHVAR